jgi:hypothetical protein
MKNQNQEDLTRRQFLRYGVTVTSGIIVPSLFTACGGSSSSVDPRQTFVQPQILVAKDGMLDITLTASYFNTTLAASNQSTTYNVSLRAYGYNGNSPSYAGPTLSLRGGEKLRVKLVNSLPANAAIPANTPDFMQYNTTNLHTHGLHVFPGIYPGPETKYGDYIFNAIAPLGGFSQYEYSIPANHPAGPFYYHPHNHGSSALQVASLMVGGLMIRGPVDDLPDMAAAKELIFLFQAPYYATEGAANNYGSANGTLENFSQIANNPSGNAPQNGNTNNGYVYVQPVLINGVRRPTIVMQSGEVQRWRLMNTQVFNFLNINLDGHVLYQYTSDGWGSVTYREYPDARLRDGLGVKLAAANRASVVVKAGAPGTYYLRTLRLQFAQGNGSSILPEDILATIIVVDSTINMAIPSAPFPVSTLLAPITDEEFASAGGKKRNIIFRSISNALLAGASKTSPITDSPASSLLPAGSDVANWVYNANATTMQNTAFVIGANSTNSAVNPTTPTATTDPSQYYPFQSSSAPTQTIILGAVEEWTIFNMNSISHPFHIHVNPMYVTKINGIPVEPYWADTQALPINGTPNAPKSITFRMRFIDYEGPYVMHCHMLQHEDMGMMQRVTVVPA